jgi:putative PIN family toxin of toxin-antitoxin system
MIAAVIDCMVYLQAATNDRGPAFACLALVESGEVILYVSTAILAEVRDVLTRPKITTKFPHLTHERAEMFLQKLATMGVVIDRIPDAGIPIRDPKDLPYLNLSVAANAGYLVSWDKDLLDLMTDKSFQDRCPNLRIVNPMEFLRLARSAQSR